MKAAYPGDDESPIPIRKGYAMNDDRVVELRHPESFSEDPLTAVLRSGAQRLLAQAVEMEVSAFLAGQADLKDDQGRLRLVRHGHHRERQVQTGIGAVTVRCPRVRDRGAPGARPRDRGCATAGPRALAIRSVSPRRSCRLISGGPSRSRS